MQLIIICLLIRPLRMLDFLGGTKQFITRHEEIDSLPIEFHNITCNSTIDIGICNLNRGSSSAVDDGHKSSIIKKRKANDDVLLQSSSSTTEPVTVIDVDADDLSCTFISDCSPFLPLKFDFLHGRIESSTSVINGKQQVTQKVVLLSNKAGFKE